MSNPKNDSIGDLPANMPAKKTQDSKGRKFDLPSIMKLVDKRCVWGVIGFIFLSTAIFLGYRYLTEDWSVPERSRITNVTSRSVTVTWITDERTKGVVVYGETNRFLPGLLSGVGKSIAFDDRDVTMARLDSAKKEAEKLDSIEGSTVDYGEIDEPVVIELFGKYYVHHVTIGGLDPQKEYFFKVGNGVRFSSVNVKEDDGGRGDNSFLTVTEIDDVPTPNPAYGTVLRQVTLESDLEPVGDAIVYLEYMPGEEVISSLMSSVTAENGSWYLDLSNARDVETGELILDYSDSGSEVVTVDAGPVGKLDPFFLLSIEDAPAESFIIKKNDSGDEESSRRSVMSYLSTPVFAIECGGGCCPDGWCYGGGTSSHESCGARASEACSGHDAPSGDGGDVPDFSPESPEGGSGVGQPCSTTYNETGSYGRDDGCAYSCTKTGTIQADGSCSWGAGSMCNKVDPNCGRQCTNGGVPCAHGTSCSTGDYECCTTGCVVIGQEPAGGGGTPGGGAPGAGGTCPAGQTYIDACGRCVANGSGAVENTTGTCACGNTNNCRCPDGNIVGPGESCGGGGSISCNCLVNGECKGKLFPESTGSCATACGNFGWSECVPGTCYLSVSECVGDLPPELEWYITAGCECETRPTVCNITISDCGRSPGRGLEWYITEGCECATRTVCSLTVSGCGGGLPPELEWYITDSCECATRARGSGVSEPVSPTVSEPSPAWEQIVAGCVTGAIAGGIMGSGTTVVGAPLGAAGGCVVGSGVGLVYGAIRDQQEMTTSVENGEAIVVPLEEDPNMLYPSLVKVYAEDDVDVDVEEEYIIIPQLGKYVASFGDYESAEFVTFRDGVKVFFFVDDNGNNIYDEGEELVYPEGYSVKVQSTAEIFGYSLNKGYNFVSFPFVMDAGFENNSASELLEYLNQDGETRVFSIAKFESGKWVVIENRNGEPYGADDFQIIPGKGYLIKTSVGLDIAISGKKVIEGVPAHFNDGWNLLGVHGSSQEYTASSLIDAIDESGDFDADNVTRWDDDKYRYEGLQKELDSTETMQVYGFDFPINDRLGYFVRIADGSGIWIPE